VEDEVTIATVTRERNQARLAAAQHAEAYDRCVEERHRLMDERDSALAELAKLRPVYQAALWCGRATHTEDANCAAGDHDDCEWREARRALDLAVHEAMKPADYEERKSTALNAAIDAATTGSKP
jgi:hypothetical protein